ncbi:MAG: hypothetical protein FGF53_02165 [Candidatus Brockarchaeota archaeon]|nr:hypothetical protein [Candidatus Brockarchaeota archaeon]MBO3808896.1 hypothetical protein [Candidatus Brockarchaeota archaeon]
MRLVQAFLLIMMLMLPLVTQASPEETRVTVSENITYFLDLNPLIGNSTTEFKSTVTVKNTGQSTIQYRFTQRLSGVDSSSLVLPPEARLLSYSGDSCVIEWNVQANPGTRIFELSGKPLWLPLTVEASLRVNGAVPNYSSAYGVFFVKCKEGDSAEWVVRLKNNNPVLLDPLTNASSKPPVFVSMTMNIPQKYFRKIVFNPPANMTSPFEKDSVSWMLILRGEAEIRVEAVVDGFDDWGTIPLTTISISSSPIGESVRESIRSQLNGLNMSIRMMNMILTPIGNLTGFINLMKKMLGNLSYGLETTGNQTIMIGEALKAIGFGLSSAASQLSQAASLFSAIAENVSKVDFNMLRKRLNSSRQAAGLILNETYRMIVDAKQGLLEINNTLTAVRNNLTNPDQISLLENATRRINNLYSRLSLAESYFESAGPQLDYLFESLESFINTLEEYGSRIVEMSSGLGLGVSALSQTSSALAEMGSALKLIGEANMMMGSNLTSVTPMLENVSSGLESVQKSLSENMTSLMNVYDELTLILRLIDYSEARTSALAPEALNGASIIFKPEAVEDGFLELNRVVLVNETRIGVRRVKVSYNGSFEGIVLNGSRYSANLSPMGILVSGNSVVIEQFRFYDDGNILTLWNGQEVSLLFSKGSQIRVEVDYSIASSLGERSEALSYSIVQPTFGKGITITVKPGGTTTPLKTGLNMVAVALSVGSIVTVALLLYRIRRKEEVIVT